MNVAWMVAGLLVFATLLGAWQVVSGSHAHRGARIALQVVAAVLLYLCLLPPSAREDFAAGELVVLTPGATPQQLAALAAGATVIALPDSTDRRDVESVPDLATALRRHPDSRRLRVVGGGLPVRDRDAARGLVAGFDAAPLRRGVVELDTPATVRAGSTWALRGRVDGVSNGRVELRDPGDAVIASGALDAAGLFEMHAQAKGAGQALFSLRVFDHDGARVEDVPVPLVARASGPLRAWLLAGAPDPELKYLRRWAADAGVAIDSRITMSEGVALTEGAAHTDGESLEANALREADVVIVDERAWASFGAAQKDALTGAVHDGLGLLLRVTGPIPAPVASDWAALGFAVRPSDAAQTVALAHALGPGDGATTFTRRALEVDAADAAPLLRADDGSPIALWRAQGQGRIALWWLADSWKLSLGGARAQFATLWGDTLATLARARGTSMPIAPANARVGERAIVCGIKPGDGIETAQGDRVDLVVDDASSGDCAAYWPAQSGWHTLISNGQRWPFHVRAVDEASALARADDAHATRALLGAPAASTTAVRAKPLPRWPFFLAWLIVAAVLWWLERRAVRTNEIV
jgi:hypothetical protein